MHVRCKPVSIPEAFQLPKLRFNGLHLANKPGLCSSHGGLEQNTISFGIDQSGKQRVNHGATKSSFKKITDLMYKTLILDRKKAVARRSALRLK